LGGIRGWFRFHLQVHDSSSWGGGIAGSAHEIWPAIASGG
jgi:hypothetical protein